MKLSVLLPTRNGGQFLRECVQSVLGQDWDDFELVVSDNANTDETPEVLADFAGDPRLKVVRLAEPVPVTENWNRALEASSGDYLLMVGDDDLLLPSYVSWACELLKANDDPDCVTYNAYSYVFPSAIEGEAVSHYADPHFCFGPQFVHGQLLAPELRRSIVADMFRFRPRIPLNMQTTLFSRRAAERLPKGVFKPPFPDHYALNSLLLTVERWLYVSDQPLVIGVSPKSFGHFVYSSKATQGLSYLGIETEFDGRLPGNELLNAMHIWLSLLVADFPAELGDTGISRADYVARQVWAWSVQWRFGELSRREALDRLRLLSAGDWLGLARLALDPEIMRQLGGRLGTKRGRTTTLWSGLRPLPGITSITGFAEWLGREGAGP